MGRTTVSNTKHQVVDKLSKNKHSIANARCRPELLMNETGHEQKAPGTSNRCRATNQEPISRQPRARHAALEKQSPRTQGGFEDKANNCQWKL